MTVAVLVSGGTGVGKTYLAQRFAQQLGLPSPISTDTIREVLRAAVPRGIQPALHTSTYVAGQTEHYQQKTLAIRRAEVLRGYKTQATAVEVGITAALHRASEEHVPVIIEGIHIRPGEGSSRDPRHTLELHVTITNERIHQQRFRQRAQDAPDRAMEKYLRSYKEIRWILDYLHERAVRYGVPIIDNSNTAQQAVEQMITAYEQWNITR